MQKTPLNVKRTDLIKTLEGRLEERIAARKTAQEARDAKNAEARDRIIALLGKHPELVVLVSNHLDRQFGHPASEVALEEAVKKAYVPQDGDTTYNPDEKLERLIRVYKLASDDTVELNVTDEAFGWL